MWWALGTGGLILYIVAFLTIGFFTLGNGHRWMFFFGIFFPILWVIGVFMLPTDEVTRASQVRTSR